MKKFKEVTDNFKVKVKSNKKLDSWMRKQRLAHKNQKLSKDRIELLNSIGFPWTPFLPIPFSLLVHTLLLKQS